MKQASKDVENLDLALSRQLQNDPQKTFLCFTYHPPDSRNSLRG